MSEDQLLREFENQEIGQNPELSDLSILPISQAASRSISPEFRFNNYYKYFDN